MQPDQPDEPADRPPAHAAPAVHEVVEVTLNIRVNGITKTIELVATTTDLPWHLAADLVNRAVSIAGGWVADQQQAEHT